MKYEYTYKGDLRTEIIHTGSSEVILSDAPKDNNGEGRFFSPTDLTASSLASCMMTIVGIRAAKSGITIRSMSGNAEKEMQSDPRRIGKIKVDIRLECDARPAQQEMLRRAAEQCPVALSLHPEIQQDLQMEFL